MCCSEGVPIKQRKQGLAAALIHQSLSVLLDFVHSDGLAALKNAVGTVALPASFVITSLYWSIVLWSPEMMVPPDSILFLPLSLDLSIHAAPFVLLLTDFLLFSPPFSKQTRPFLVAVVATTAYTSWMEYCQSFNKSYPYPFLNDMTLSVRLPFYGFVCLLLFAFFHVANYTHFGFDKLVGRDVKISKLQTERKIA